MAKHIVICQVCGRQFDESIEGAHYDRNSRRYTCMDCVNSQRKNTTGGKKQGHGAMIAKIVIGAIFFVSGFTTGSVGPTLVGVIIGLGLIAWGLLPVLLPRIQAKKEAESAEAARKAEEERLANEPKTCPACGAHTKGHVCEYCGEPLK